MDCFREGVDCLNQSKRDSFGYEAVPEVEVAPDVAA